MKHKCRNKQILYFNVEQAVLDYNVGYLKGHLCDKLKLSMSKITKSNLEKKGKRREKQSQDLKKRREVKDEVYTARGPFRFLWRGYTCRGDL